MCTASVVHLVTVSTLSGCASGAMTGAAMSDRLLTRTEAADYLAIPVGTLANMATRREGPAIVRIGRTVRYRLAELDRWINANTERMSR
jgi:excisionase family DNA binding protein